MGMNSRDLPQPQLQPPHQLTFHQRGPRKTPNVDSHDGEEVTAVTERGQRQRRGSISPFQSTATPDVRKFWGCGWRLV